MAIAYKSQGAGVATEASGGALSPLCPAVVAANDILIAHCAYEGTTTTPSTPANWTLLGGPYTIESAYRHWIFGKIAAGTEDGGAVAFGTPAVTTVRWARVYSFSGWVSGAITDNVPAASFAHLSHATDPQMPTVTTTVAGARAVACIAQADDNAQASATGESGGDWVEAVAEYVQAATTPDTGMGIQTCIPTDDPGTVTGGSISTANDPCGVIGFEIRPSAPANVSVTPGTLALTLATFAALVTATANVLVTPAPATLSLASFAPTVTASDNKTVTPSTASLSLSTFASTVTTTDHKTATPGTASLTASLFAPTVSVSDNQIVVPGALVMTTTGFAPVVSATEHMLVTPGVASLILATFAPTVTASSSVGGCAMAGCRRHGAIV